MIDSVRRTIRSYGLLPPGSRVAVALSGGADSVALLVALRELAGAEGFLVVGAAHMNHQLRGADADADARSAATLLEGLGMPIELERDGRRAAGGRHRRIDRTRRAFARHAFFERAAARLGATAVAVAHTKDDQAETFLLRLLRGRGRGA